MSPEHVTSYLRHRILRLDSGQMIYTQRHGRKAELSKKKKKYLTGLRNVNTGMNQTVFIPCNFAKNLPEPVAQTNGVISK